MSRGLETSLQRRNMTPKHHQLCVCCEGEWEKLINCLICFAECRIKGARKDDAPSVEAVASVATRPNLALTQCWEAASAGKVRAYVRAWQRAVNLWSSTLQQVLITPLLKAATEAEAVEQLKVCCCTQQQLVLTPSAGRNKRVGSRQTESKLIAMQFVQL